MTLRSTLEDTRDRLNTLLAYINNITEQDDTNLGDAIENLANSSLNNSSFDSVVYEFDQRNAQAIAYLNASQSYVGSDYTSSVMSTYDDQSTVSYERPVGYTVNLKSAGTLMVVDESTGSGWSESATSGSYTIYNLTPNHVWRWILTDSNGVFVQGGRVRPTGNLRMLKLNSNYLHNFRDIGGWSCDGGTIKYGKLIRGAQMVTNNGQSLYTQADVNIMRNIGVSVDVDLRGTDEYAQSASPLGNDIYFVNEDLDYYANALSTEAATTAKVLKEIMESVSRGGSVYFNCQAGADRTGTIAFMLELVLGVALTDCDRDYELTSFYPQTGYNRYRTDSNYKAMANYMINLYDFSNIRDNAVKWCLNNGITINELNQFRRACINGTPTDLDVEDYGTYYSVSTSATNCQINVSSISVEEGTSLTGIVVVGESLTLTNVQVTMGGVDITSTAVSGKNINIASVTGNVHIVAVAEEALTNMLPLATESNGSTIYPRTSHSSLFTVGYATGYRLGSAGTESTQSGAYVTGFIPVEEGSTVTLKNIKLPYTNMTNYGWCYITFYNSSFTKIASYYSYTWTKQMNQLRPYVADEDNYLTSFTVASTSSTYPVTGAKYMRISALEITNDSAIYVE